MDTWSQFGHVMAGNDFTAAKTPTLSPHSTTKTQAVSTPRTQAVSTQTASTMPAQTAPTPTTTSTTTITTKIITVSSGQSPYPPT